MNVDSTALSGVWWRHVPAGADVLQEPEAPADNRWQRGPQIGALYFASDKSTAWAEWYRYLAEAAVPPVRALPRDLWRWEISLPVVADLGDDARLARVGLPPMLPTRRQWSEFQLVGEQLHAKGWRALVSSSAARPEGCTLCLFRTAPAVPGARPIPPPELVANPPVVPTGLRT